MSSDGDKQAFLDGIAELNVERTITGKSQLDVILCNQPVILASVKVDNRLKSVYTTDYPPYHTKLNLNLKPNFLRKIATKIDSHFRKQTGRP